MNVIKKLAKGWTSEIYLVERNGKKLVLKQQKKEKCNRPKMVEKEVENLKLANSVGLGPRLIDFDLEERWVLMEYIEGPTFNEWLFEKKPAKKQLEKFLKELFKQVEKLDSVGLDHGQLAGKGKNILVRRGKPVIVDFEKASTNRKTHNRTQLEAFIYRNPHSAITKRIREILNN